MKIKKATKKDFEEYYKLKKNEEKEYLIIIGEKRKIPSKKELYKEFLDITSRKNRICYLTLYGDNSVAYMNIVINKTIWSKSAYIEDLFVKREFRKKGIATKLINEFINFSKDNGIKKIFLSVIIKNSNAIKLYKKLGFKLTRYDMEKKLT